MSSHLRLERVPICQSGLAIDRVCELLLCIVSKVSRDDAVGIAHLAEPVVSRVEISIYQKGNDLYNLDILLNVLFVVCEYFVCSVDDENLQDVRRLLA